MKFQQIIQHQTIIILVPITKKWFNSTAKEPVNLVNHMLFINETLLIPDGGARARFCLQYILPFDTDLDCRPTLIAAEMDLEPNPVSSLSQKEPHWVGGQFG